MACSRAVVDAWTFEERAQQIEQRWRELLGRVRANSSADLILRSLPGMPVLTANSAAALISRSFPAANSAVAQLVEAGILKQVNIGRRNRAFEAAEIVAAFTDLERQLASPAGDTRKSVLRSM
jgi:hypothetical protein